MVSYPLDQVKSQKRVYSFAKEIIQGKISCLHDQSSSLFDRHGGVRQFELLVLDFYRDGRYRTFDSTTAGEALREIQ